MLVTNFSSISCVTNNTRWWHRKKINSTEVIKFNNLNLTEFYNATRPEIKMIHCVSAGLGDCSKFWRVGSASKYPHFHQPMKSLNSKFWNPKSPNNFWLLRSNEHAWRPGLNFYNFHWLKILPMRMIKKFRLESEKPSWEHGTDCECWNGCCNQYQWFNFWLVWQASRIPLQILVSDSSMNKGNKPIREWNLEPIKGVKVAYHHWEQVPVEDQTLRTGFSQSKFTI